MITDIFGCILCIMVTSSQPHDTALAVPLVTKTLEKYPSLEIFAVGYRGTTAQHIILQGKEVIIPEPKEGEKVSKKRKMDCGANIFLEFA